MCSELKQTKIDRRIKLQKWPFVNVQGGVVNLKRGVPWPREWELYLFFIFYYNFKACSIKPA